MNETQGIRHEGIVTEIRDNVVLVRIERVSACSKCHAKEACIVSDKEEKIVEVPKDGQDIRIGQTVDVVLQEHSGLKALFLGYILPFIVFFAALLIATSFTKKEVIAGIISLAVLIPYYISLYFFRDRLKKTFVFKLEKVN